MKRGRVPHGTLIAVGSETLRTVGQRFTAHRFRSLVDGRPLLAATLGDVSTPEPILATARRRAGGAIDPIAVYRSSGHRRQAAERRPAETRSSAGIV